MTKIYWYRKPNGELLDIGENHAWQLHREYISHRHNYKYLGWSDGRFIQAVKNNNKMVRDENGVMQKFTQDTEKAIYEAIDKELENANMQAPIDKSREEFGQGGIGGIQTPGLAQRLR